MIITFEEFIQRYNKVYNTNVTYLFTNTLDICSIMENLFNNSEFDIDEENKTIELF